MLVKNFTPLLWIGFLIISNHAVANNKLSQQLAACADIQSDYGRLVCYDRLSNSVPEDENQPSSEAETPSQQPPTDSNSQLPPLVADINEAGFMYSLGQMDLLGEKFDAMLVGIGHRVNVADFSFSQQPDIYFNVFGQIRGQFDVEELTTRNNRGGALINADYTVGGELVQHRPDWKWRLSYRHRSTHLGDEFLIENQDYLKKRFNLSYETIEFMAFKSFNQWDIYGGGAYLTRMEPSGLNPLQWQAGWQYQAAKGQDFNPIVGIDLSSWTEADRNLNVTLRAGIEVNKWLNRPVSVFLQYQEGHAPYGQFFTEDFNYFGMTIYSHW